ncbi:MAG: peptidase T [Mogibacterium sp.]|nr:peptidase T [Mogibacterium sp.]
MKAYERLLRYVAYRTPSDESSNTHPSSACQFRLAEALVEELKELGVNDAMVDEHCYVYGHIPASPGCENVTPIGLIAHMDTVADYCDHDTVPVITENYDGKALPLGDSGLVLDPQVFPHLKELKGQTLITTDGTTILGADDKAGIAEIMTVVEELAGDHGPISIAFTPDEEIGTGALQFDVDRFGAKYAYTLDGDLEGSIEYETFNAAQARIHVHGEAVHPGTAKGVMVNAALVAMEFNSLLPAAERPERTEGYDGFYHLTGMSGNVAEAHLSYIIRDHSDVMLESRKYTMELAASFLNERYGEGTVEVTIRDQYRNMAEVIRQHPVTVEYAKQASQAAGMEPLVKPIRGGTDGSHLSFMGLPCPNLGTAGAAYHGPYEHITAEGMDKVVSMLHALIRIYTENPEA